MRTSGRGREGPVQGAEGGGEGGVGVLVLFKMLLRSFCTTGDAGGCEM